MDSDHTLTTTGVFVGLRICVFKPSHIFSLVIDNDSFNKYYSKVTFKHFGGFCCHGLVNVISITEIHLNIFFYL